MADTFISYASEDRHRVQQIAVSLEAEGWTVWWDRELVGGTAFDEVIERELDTAGCVIVCWSKIATESQWVRDEAEEARSRGVIVPVRLEDVRVPLRFRRLHNLDLISWDGSTTATAFRQVVEAVTRIVGPPPAPVLTEGVEEDSGPDASAVSG